MILPIAREKGEKGRRSQRRGGRSGSGNSTELGGSLIRTSRQGRSHRSEWHCQVESRETEGKREEDQPRDARGSEEVGRRKELSGRKMSVPVDRKLSRWQRDLTGRGLSTRGEKMFNSYKSESSP